MAATWPTANPRPPPCRHRALRLRGWRVLPVLYSEWCTLEDEEARRKYLIERVVLCSQGGRGRGGR